MNLTFWICFVALVVGCWFLLSSHFGSIGGCFREMFNHTKEAINEDDAKMPFEKLCYDELLDLGQTFATAESCTGGLIAKRITDFPGASQVFRGGIVCYTNGVKQNVLGVPASVLQEHGAVSRRCAEEMAKQIRLLTGADFGISVTGVAGPDPDDRGNPVGTVYLGFSSKDETVAYFVDFGNNSRSHIRACVADTAFDLLHDKILMIHKGSN